MKIISRGGSLHNREIEEKLKALDRSQAVIEFAMDGYLLLGSTESVICVNDHLAMSESCAGLYTVLQKDRSVVGVGFPPASLPPSPMRVP